jgi:hypothetical protein
MFSQINPSTFGGGGGGAWRPQPFFMAAKRGFHATQMRNFSPDQMRQIVFGTASKASSRG